MSDAIRDAARDVLPMLYVNNRRFDDSDARSCRACGALPHFPACPVAALERAVEESDE